MFLYIIKGLSKYGDFNFELNENSKEEDFVNIEVIDCNDGNKKLNLNIDLYGNIYEAIRKNVSYDDFYLKYKDKNDNEIFLGPVRNIDYLRAILKIYSDYHSEKKIILELYNVEMYKGYMIFIKTFTGKTLDLRCNYDETIYELKRKLFIREGTSPNDVRLIFAGKQLEENRTMADYNIQKESTIHQVLRLRVG